MASEAPSKTVLLEHRSERDLVREGKAVLEDRRDLLAHMLVQQLRECEQLLDQTRDLWTEARDLLRRAIMRHGRYGLETFSAGESRAGSPEWRVLNRLGTPWLEAGAPTGIERHAVPPLPDGAEPSIELEAARRTLQHLLAVLLPLATAHNNLVRLTDVFRRTQRRVNALEHIILPELDQSIKGMEDRMDEMERDDLVRSLLIKRRQT